VNTANVTAWGIYDNDSATEVDITNLVSWNVADEAIAVISEGATASDGIGGVVSNGTASDGTTTATAELDGITSSNAVNITACNTLAGPCIDAYELSDGKIITNPPSRAYLSLVGVSGGLDFNEVGGAGPVGTFVATRTYNSTIEPQDICDAYSLNGLKGRTNWMWTTTNDLIELDGEVGDPSSTRGWPTGANYWWWDGGSNDELSSWRLDGGAFSTDSITHSVYGDPVYTLCTSVP
ncbi:hypothetical protein H2D57_25290, partial [Vibrio alginolyticus]|nr:hypothetical protein [Vibrio alginolyticus]